MERYVVLKEAIAMDAFHDGRSIRVRLVAMALLIFPPYRGVTTTGTMSATDTTRHGSRFT
jgi:hypothetical protein